jgi:hypothetical protein
MTPGPTGGFLFFALRHKKKVPRHSGQSCAAFFFFAFYFFAARPNGRLFSFLKVKLLEKKRQASLL